MAEQDIADHQIWQGDVDWVDEDGRILLRRPKFGAFGSKVLKLFRVNPILTVRLDAIGSAAWHLMDGRTVAEVLQDLEDRFPDEGRLAERFGLYLQRLVASKLVKLDSPAKVFK